MWYAFAFLSGRYSAFRTDLQDRAEKAKSLRFGRTFSNRDLGETITTDSWNHTLSSKFRSGTNNVGRSIFDSWDGKSSPCGKSHWRLGRRGNLVGLNGSAHVSTYQNPALACVLLRVNMKVGIQKT